MGGIPEIIISKSGKKMPVIGMGTSSYPPADPETAKLAILEAIKAGYRHFDTAFAYGSEKPLGEAISEALREGLIESREELFITTKLWSSFAAGDQVVQAMKMSLENLGLEYVDMYLIHLPVRLTQMVNQMPPPKEWILPLDIKAVWEAMEECQNLGLTKAIGVSNFTCKMLTQLLSIAKIPPATNQVELSPCWRQNELRKFCKANNIHITAYSPLGAPSTKWGDNRVIGSSVLEEIAKEKGKTIAQVSLRWVYEQGVSLVTKSFNRERMRENLDIFDWSLTDEESNKISQLPQHKGVTLSSIFGDHDLVREIEAEL